MKVIVFGATGKVGGLVTKYALEAGHEVTAFVRNKKRLEIEDRKLSVVEGDIHNKDLLTTTMDGHDVAISSIGGPFKLFGAPDSFYWETAEAITEAMKQVGVQRFICVSSGLAKKGRDKDEPLFISQVKRLFWRAVLSQMARMEEVVANSGVEYTIVRPPRLNDEERTGKYKLQECYVIKGSMSIPRADVADFIVKEIAEKSYLNKAVAIATV